MNAIKDYQDIIFSIYRDCIGVCRQKSIPCFLIDGSCLGAVRHKGMIPWDDDIDIGIFSSDYEEFFSNIKEALGTKYTIVEPFEQDKYPFHTDILGKIYDTKWTFRNKAYGSGANEFTHPYMDVMLICGLPNNKIAAFFYYKRVLLTKYLLKLSNRESIGFYSDKKRGWIERGALTVLKRVDISFMLNEDRISNYIRYLLLKYNPHKSKRVFVFQSDYREREIVPYDYYGQGREEQFGSLKVSIPAKAELYLQQIYGDYMKIPDESSRHTHIVFEYNKKEFGDLD